MTALENNDRETGVETNPPRCFHCSSPCLTGSVAHSGHSFCCQGCKTVFELLTENGLDSYYGLVGGAGIRLREMPAEQRFLFLDQPEIRARLADFQDESSTHITFTIPAIHCVACVWLLENLFHLAPGIGHTSVNFPRKQVSIVFDSAKISLSRLVHLLASLGYEPELRLSDLDAPVAHRMNRRLWLQVGLAGFAFGNIMLFSISSYFGLDRFSGPSFRMLTDWMAFALATPVVFYSGADYWRSAWVSLRQRMLNIDVPIAVGLAAIYLQSAWAVVVGREDHYFDSLCGLLFFLLCGKMFQQKTFDRLAFNRDYRSFFPLSVTRVVDGEATQVPISQLQAGDRLRIRSSELIPADSRVISGPVLIDYSFVTGESSPVRKQVGELVYAGGRQVDGAVELEMVKAVSESYLASLWNKEAFRKEKAPRLETLTNCYSQRFTKIVVLIALGAGLYWSFTAKGVALKAFTSVLIVACPCALALAAPFALGTAQRCLARRSIFLKSSAVIEALANIDAVVFDKTGTLTAPFSRTIGFIGRVLKADETLWIRSLAAQSAHPLSVRISEALAGDDQMETVHSFRELPGCGIEAFIAGRSVAMGSARWLKSCFAGFRDVSAAQDNTDEQGSVVCVAIDGIYRGRFILVSSVRDSTKRLLGDLSHHCSLALLSGDNDRERERFGELFNVAGSLHFNQSPAEKLEFIRNRQRAGHSVMMVGDGLNDAGALKQSDVGVAVVESLQAFSPASDVILRADRVVDLGRVLKFSKSVVRVIRSAFLISAAYNLAGISIAASGRLSPIVCAILMPLSSVTVVLFATGAVAWRARSLGGAGEAAVEGARRIPAVETLNAAEAST